MFVPHVDLDAKDDQVSLEVPQQNRENSHGPPSFSTVYPRQRAAPREMLRMLRAGRAREVKEGQSTTASSGGGGRGGVTPALRRGTGYTALGYYKHNTKVPKPAPAGLLFCWGINLTTQMPC